MNVKYQEITEEDEWIRENLKEKNTNIFKFCIWPWCSVLSWGVSQSSTLSIVEDLFFYIIFLMRIRTIWSSNFWYHSLKNHDWVSTAKKNLLDFQICMSFQEIKLMKISKCQTIVQTSIRSKALGDLTVSKLKHTKVLHIPHAKLKTQEYLIKKELTNSEKVSY